MLKMHPDVYPKKPVAWASEWASPVRLAETGAMVSSLKDGKGDSTPTLQFVEGENPMAKNHSMICTERSAVTRDIIQLPAKPKT